MARRIMLLIAAAAFLWGCARVTPRPPQAPTSLFEGSAPRSISAQAIVELRRGFAVSGKATVLARSPDLFRIEVAGPFGQPLAVISGDDKSLVIANMGKTDAYDWEDPDLPYPFDSKELVSVLLGDGAVKDHGDVSYGVTGARGSAVVITKLREGAPVFRISLDDFREVSGKRLPFRIKIEDDKSAIQIRYTSVDVDPVIKDSAFGLPPIPAELP